MSSGLVSVIAMPTQAASCHSVYSYKMPVGRQSNRHTTFRAAYAYPQDNASPSTPPHVYPQTVPTTASYSPEGDWANTASHSNISNSASGAYYALPGRAAIQTEISLRLGNLQIDDIDGLLDVIYDIFRQVDTNQLEEAGHHLVLVGDWMARNVKSLGLTIVNAANRTFTQGRKTFLSMYNKAWLVALQRQNDYLSCNQAGTDLSSCMSRDQLKQMGRDFINTNDILQPYGLVDYEGGVLEEEILEQIEECINLWEDLWRQAEQVVAAGRNG